MRSSKGVQGVIRGAHFGLFAAKLHDAVQPQSRRRKLSRMEPGSEWILICRQLLAENLRVRSSSSTLKKLWLIRSLLLSEHSLYIIRKNVKTSEKDRASSGLLLALRPQVSETSSLQVRLSQLEAI